MRSVVGSHSGCGARNTCGIFGTEYRFEIVPSDRKRFKPVTRSPRQPRRIGKPSPQPVTVKAKAGDKNFKWDDKTVVSPKGSTPAVGDKVTVTSAKDSDMATKIAIHKAKAAKASKAAKGDEKKPN